MIPTDIWSQLFNMFLWVFMLGFVLPKLTVYQMTLKLENSAIVIADTSSTLSSG